MIYYKSKQHKRWREIVLRRDQYRCQMCKRKGKNREATHAHHIVPISIDASRALELRNGIALCGECHNEIEPRTGEYTPPDWMARRAVKPS